MTTQQKQLILQYHDGTLPDDRGEELERLLAENREARRYYRLIATIEDGLEERGNSISVSRIETASQAFKFNPKLFFPWVISTVAIAILVIQNIPIEQTNQEVSQAENFHALLVDEAEARFASGKSPDEVRFDTGEYELVEGAIHVRFSNGADLVMKAPAQFTINDSFLVGLDDGAVRAIVPPSAKGFTIATPGIDYEDLGTEFGLAVNGGSGESELHVFNGQVDVKKAQSESVLSSVYEGESVRYAQGNLSPTNVSRIERFLTPGAIGYLRWKAQVESFRTQKDLIGYYPFIRKDDRKQLVNYAKYAQASDGQIEGARWVSGRWSGKRALLFDRDSDFVEVDIGGEYQEITLATWLKADRFDFSHTAILDSNGWEEGAIHWQFNRGGNTWIAPYGVSLKSKVPRLEMETGRWVHLAGTISLVDKRSNVYINGELADSREFAETVLLKPGKCRIGNWLWDEEWPHSPIRAFRGRIDEFAIWGRILSQSEVQDLVETGKPAALWSSHK